METFKVKYVQGSHVFKNCGLAWIAYSQHDGLTFGGNVFSLVSGHSVIDVPEEMLGYDDSETDKEIRKVLRRVKSLKTDTYVDLES